MTSPQFLKKSIWIKVIDCQKCNANDYWSEVEVEEKIECYFCHAEPEYQDPVKKKNPIRIIKKFHGVEVEVLVCRNCYNEQVSRPVE